MEEADPLAALKLEFDVLARRAQLEIFPERRAQLLEDFAELQRMLRVIRSPRPADHAPDGSFDVSTVIRML